MKHDRMARVNRLLQTTLADLIPGAVKDPRVQQPVLISVVEVRASPDLQHAKVFLAIHGEAAQRAEALEGLRQASGYLRGELGRRVRLRRIPELHFVEDESLDVASRIEGILRDLTHDHGDS